ncbi:LSU ribosomal protein L22p (L17e) [Clostridiaceae bacterium JG1575]|nr:LSU ribosomal protein L22p (L17e) [Clostridiaceae bacterium JG1575]
MLDEKNLNETADQAEETVVLPEEGTKNQAPKADAKAASRAQAREKAKAKRSARKERLSQKETKETVKVRLSAEEKAQKREEKAKANEKVAVKAIARYIRMSPMKVNIVLDLIRGKNVDEAMTILQFTPKDAAVVVGKVLKSAVANAENNFELDRAGLYVSECHVGPGPIIKRYQPHAQGRAFSIHKRTSHITVIVAERA